MRSSESLGFIRTKQVGCRFRGCRAVMSQPRVHAALFQDGPARSCLESENTCTFACVLVQSLSSVPGWQVTLLASCTPAGAKPECPCKTPSPPGFECAATSKHLQVNRREQLSGVGAVWGATGVARAEHQAFQSLTFVRGANFGGVRK